MKELNNWDMVPTLYSYTYITNRGEFFYPQDTNSCWAIFAVETGEFKYEMGDISGIATDMDIILCPPGIAFKRKILSSLTC